MPHWTIRVRISRTQLRDCHTRRVSKGGRGVSGELAGSAGGVFDSTLAKLDSAIAAAEQELREAAKAEAIAAVEAQYAGDAA